MRVWRQSLWSSAAKGEKFRARLKIGGKVVRVVAFCAGQCGP